MVMAKKGEIKVSILEELKDLEIKENLAGELKRQTIPLVMWGAGEIADEVNFYLQKNNINLADVFVDDEYYSENKLFNGKPVISMSELGKKYTQVNIILGCSNYEKMKCFEQLVFVNKVFYLFSYSYGIYEKTAFSEIAECINEFEKVGSVFADHMSYKNYIAFLKTRVSGNNSYIFEVFKKESNYFNNDIFQVDNNEVFLDIGAYDGDTIRLFLKENSGQYKYIYALEPDELNRNKLKNYIENDGLQNITVSGTVPWEQKGELHFVTNDNGQLSSLAFNVNNKMEGIKGGIKAEPLDTMFEYHEKITLIKINYLEGVKEALQGAKNILKAHQPKLAISVGFDCKNIRCIPLLIKEINPNYKIFLRYNRGTISTLMCYAIV